MKKKKEWLKDVIKTEKWRMAEGNPTNDVKHELTDELTEFLTSYKKRLNGKN